MAYASIAAGLLAAMCWGTSDYLSRSQSERMGHYRTVVFSQISTLAILVLLVPVLGVPTIPASLALIALLAAGVSNFFAFIFLYRAFHKGVVSVVAPVAYTYPAVTTILSIAFLGTLLTGFQSFAITAVIVGVLLVSTRFSELRASLGGRGAPNLTAGIGSAVGAALFFGVAYLGVGYAAPLVSLVLPAIILRIVGVGAGAALSPVFKASVKPSRNDFSKTIWVMGVFEAIGFLSFTFGISGGGGSLPIVAALSGMGGAVATTYAFAFLRE
ncbi:MAG TPA: DMT family transporter, partial [Nitrososphaerales archaeon]|nr:DMT family transporter [Nitrososphaerales archaeon]